MLKIKNYKKKHNNFLDNSKSKPVYAKTFKDKLDKSKITFKL